MSRQFKNNVKFAGLQDHYAAARDSQREFICTNIEPYKVLPNLSL